MSRLRKSIREEAQDKLFLNELVISSGFVHQYYFSLRSETKIRVVTCNTGPGNKVTVRANIIDSPYFNIFTITGDQNVLIDVGTYDHFQIECTTYGGVPFEVTISSFFVGVVYL